MIAECGLNRTIERACPSTCYSRFLLGELMVECILLAFIRKTQIFVWVLCDETLTLGLFNKSIKHDPGCAKIPEDRCILHVVACVSFKICDNDTHQLKHWVSTLFRQVVCDRGE